MFVNLIHMESYRVFYSDLLFTSMWLYAFAIYSSLQLYSIPPYDYTTNHLPIDDVELYLGLIIRLL